MMDDLPSIEEPIAAPDADGVGPPPGPEWREDSRGRQFVPRPKGGGKSGVIFRRDNETIAEALARDLKPKDERPHRRSKKPKMPDAPRKPDLRELEETLANALKSPAMICAGFGDQWGAEHFTAKGPYLARNLVLASQSNPWLRKKLEEAATGEDAMMMVVGLVGVGGALFAYAIPPIIYYFNLPASKQMREMLDIPPRREQPASNAAAPSPAPSFADAA